MHVYCCEEILCLCYDGHLSPIELHSYLNKCSGDVVILWQSAKETSVLLPIIQSNSCGIVSHLNVAENKYSVGHASQHVCNIIHPTDDLRYGFIL